MDLSLTKSKLMFLKYHCAMSKLSHWIILLIHCILKRGITVTVYILKRKLSFFLFILIKILIDPCLCMIEKFFVKKNTCFYVMQMEHIHKAYFVKECVRLRSNLISLIREGYKLTNLRCDKIISTLVSLRL